MVAMDSAPVDYDGLMQANLKGVFSERDAALRNAAIAALYADDATLYEPDSVARGHAAIGAAVTALLDRLPPTFSFSAIAPASGHHGVGRLRWQSGPAGGPAAVTGMDIAHIIDGCIHALYVFLEPVGN